MFDLIILAIAVAGGQGGSGNVPLAEPTGVAEIHRAAEPGLTVTGSGNLVAEPQISEGRFTTATEVRPILEMTERNWVAVREFNGQDLVYVTHLLAWRCGLVRIRYGINESALQDWPMPACHEDMAAPNALLPDDGLPYITAPLKSVESVQIELTYDDLALQAVSFERSAVLAP